jgi:tripartite-type tricarboxylate transporter receptor subunit TctC
VAPEIVRSLNADVQALLGAADTQARFAQMGGVPAPGTAADFAAFVRAETTKWGEVIRREGLQMDAS